MVKPSPGLWIFGLQLELQEDRTFNRFQDSVRQPFGYLISPLTNHIRIFHSYVGHFP